MIAKQTFFVDPGSAQTVLPRRRHVSDVLHVVDPQ